MTWGVVAAALSLAACGGSDGGGLSGVGGASGAAGTASGGSAGKKIVDDPYPLAEVCQKTAPIGCEMSRSCCEKSGFGYQPSGCEAHAISECQKNVAEVEAGTMTYDPSAIDACLPALDSLLDRCVIGYAELFESLDALKTCSRIWQGQRPLGASCDRDVQCALSADPDVFVSCDRDIKICIQARRLAENAACQAWFDAPDFCGAGLYCDAALVPPYSGVCRPAVLEGQSCNAVKAYNLECGAGFYCNKATSLCTRGKAGGTDCGESFECQSYQCVFGKCASLEPLVTQNACTG